MKRNKTGNWTGYCCIGMLLAFSGMAWGADKEKPGNGSDKKTMHNGLVAHYFRDPINWNGAWPDDMSKPTASPLNYTFASYAYSRVEPLINHHFINDGWFSVRWTGYFDLSATARVKGTNEAPEVVFTMWADDGCRLFVDGVKVIDSWMACWEKTDASWRKSPPIALTDGPHRIVVEYFQGLSQKADDTDPIKLYWTCPGRKVDKPQIVPAAYFSHTDDDMQTTSR